MRERERPEKERDVRPAATPQVAMLARSAPDDRAAMIARLQASAGNHAVAGLLARHGAGDHDHARPEAGGAGAGTAPAPTGPGTQAQQEAEAVQTVGLLRRTYNRMLNSPNVRTRNTAQMLDPPGERPQGHRMRVETMTLRSDSAQLIADRGDPVATTAYYFRGTRQDNELQMGPRTLGTIDGSTVVIRGKLPDGSWRTDDDFEGTLVHETSHVLVASYGEHPGTVTDAASFDRYKDEFRAYFVEPTGYFSTLVGAAKVQAIRDQLVGTSATAGGYEHLRAQFWAEPLATNQFRAQVLAHNAPDGFNIDNSPRLDRFVNMLSELRNGRATVEEVVFQITVLSPAERSEAAGATLITRLLNRLQPAEAARLRTALAAPAAVGFGRELNPHESPRITSLLGAITGGEPEERIKEAYRNCTPTDRGDLYMNPHVISWINRAMSDGLRRACVINMFNTGRLDQYDATWEVQQACWRATSEAAGAGATMPDYLRTALRRLNFTARLSFYRFGEDAYRIAVNPLPDPIKRQVVAILRGEGDP